MAYVINFPGEISKWPKWFSNAIKTMQSSTVEEFKLDWEEQYNSLFFDKFDSHDCREMYEIHFDSESEYIAFILKWS